MSSPLILGAGPAGIAVALCCKEIGLSPVVVDPAPESGGLIARSHWPAIWTPWTKGKSGAEMGRELAERFRASGIPRVTDEALSLDPVRRVVGLKDGGETSYRALVIATGVDFRQIEEKGAREAEAAGWLIQRPPLRPEAAFPPDGTVIVLGGGNNAFSTASMEAKDSHASRVIIAVRGEQIHARADILQETAAFPNVALRMGWQVREFLPDHSIRFDTPKGERIEKCTLVYANLGYVPRSAFASCLQRDEAGHLEIDSSHRTSAEDIWAVGEVVGPKAPSVLTVMGQAPLVATEISAALEDREETMRLVEKLRNQ